MNLKKSISVYTFTSVLGQAVPLLLLPVLTRYLSQDEYGRIATLSAVFTFLTPIVFWGVAAVVSVEYFKLDSDNFKSYLGSASILTLITFVLASVTIFVFSNQLSSWLDIPPFWLILAPAFCLCAFTRHLLSTLLRVRNDVTLFAGYEIISAVIGVVLTMLFVVVLKGGWEGRMYATLFSAVLLAIASCYWFYLKGYFHFSWRLAYMKDAFKFGAGLIPHDLGNQIIRTSDRIFLVLIVGLSGAGQYAVAAQVAGIMLVLLSAFNQAWTPYLFSQLKSDDPKAKLDVVKKSYIVMATFFLFFVVFNLCIPLFYRIFVDEKFSSSMEYVLWLTLGYFFTSVYLTYIDYIFYLKKTHILSIITFINMAINLILNYFFINTYGAIGSAYAFCITMFVVMALAFLLSNRLYPMPWFFWTKRAA